MSTDPTVYRHLAGAMICYIMHDPLKMTPDGYLYVKIGESAEKNIFDRNSKLRTGNPDLYLKSISYLVEEKKLHIELADWWYHGEFFIIPLKVYFEIFKKYGFINIELGLTSDPKLFLLSEVKKINNGLKIHSKKKFKKIIPLLIFSKKKQNEEKYENFDNLFGTEEKLP